MRQGKDSLCINYEFLLRRDGRVDERVCERETGDTGTLLTGCVCVKLLSRGSLCPPQTGFRALPYLVQLPCSPTSLMAP